jgi:hypothetical protein
MRNQSDLVMKLKWVKKILPYKRVKILTKIVLGKVCHFDLSNLQHVGLKKHTSKYTFKAI